MKLKYFILTLVIISAIALSANAQTVAPVLNPIGAQSTTENVLLSFTVTATDGDATTPTLTTSTLPTGASFIDNGDGTGTFSWTPNFTDAGVYNVTFTANDAVTVDTDEEIVTITVNEAGNQAPVVSDIPDQTIDEGATFATIDLNTYVADADNLDSEISWTFSGNTELTVAIDVSNIATITIPNVDWNGAEAITFTATDPGLLSANDPATFTVNAVNDAPVLAAIGPQSVTEGALLTVNVSASDVDGTTPALSASPLPTGANFTDNNDGTGVLTWTPTFTDAGSYDITFTADDGTLNDFELVTVTVNEAGNQAPVVSDIPDQTVDEGSTFATVDLNTYVADPDNLDSEISWTFSGNTELTVSIDVSNIATITIPDINWNGAEVITFTATDPGLLSANDPATFTVNAVNDAPVVSDIPDQTIDEGSTFATVDLNTYVSDVDNLDSEISWTFSGNTELTVSIDVSNIATITIPDINWNGAEAITFTATDPGLLSANDPATFTVNAINDAPVVSDIPDQTIDEGSTFATVDLNTYVSDVDNLDSEISWTFSGNSSLSVVIDASNIATISAPSADWNGAETITFTATDPGLLSVNDAALFTINPVNDAPVLAAIGPQSVTEGALLTVNVSASDVDGTTPALSASPLPTGANFTDNNDGTGTLTWTPTFTDAGSYDITFTADDGTLNDFELVTVTVSEAGNQAPVVSDIPDQSISEGASFATVDLNTYVADPDNLDSEISWTISGNTDLSVAIDAGNVATITPPDANWNGSETITFTATDPGLLTANDPATFTISAVNDGPLVADIPNQTIDEGASFATIDLNTYVTDPDNLPSEMTWTYSGNTELTVAIDASNIATITIPSVDWFGSEIITFTATDPGLAASSDPAQFTVNNVNDAPVVADIPDQTIDEGSTFATVDLNTYVTDIDNLASEISWTYSGNTELTVAIDVANIATITIPTIDWNGAEVITFTATDPGLLSANDPATFTVNAVNDAPVLAAIGPQSGTENVLLTFNVSATDVDGTTPALSASPLPTGASFVDNTDGTGTFSWTPTFTDAGAYDITFTADDGTLTDFELVTVTIGEAGNQAPVVSDIPDQTIDEGATFATIDLNTYVADADNLDSEISWTFSGNTELGVSIDVSNIATITIPNVDWNGAETITFTATDPGLLTNNDAAIFTVNAVNDAPVVADIPDQTIDEGATFTLIDLNTYVSDVDNLNSELTWSYSGNTELTVSIDPTNVATITIPSTEWNGVETITFTATDPGLLSGNDPATFTVNAVNDAPVVSDIPDQTINEGATFATIDLNTYVTDIDNLNSEITWTYSGNTELTVAIDISNIATITIPSVDWNGAETITFTATDPGLLSANDVATFTVNAVNDAPVVTDIPDQTVAEGSTFTTIDLNAYVSDVDNLNSELTWTYSGNTELTVSIDLSNIATVAIPTVNWNGSELITFTATDPGLLAGSDGATFTVTGVNDAPIVTDIPNETIDEGGSFATIDLNTYVSDLDNLDSEISWTYSGNSALIVSIDASNIATVTTPDPDWNGIEIITFTATDPGLLSDSDPATFTVNAVNDAPVVADIPDQTVAEGATFTTIDLNGYVADVDNADNEITWTYSGNTELTVAIDVANIATVTIPTVDWNGSELITFTATDPGLLANSDGATFTVTAVNDAPVVADIPDQTIDEGATFTTIDLNAYVTDADNLDSEISWTYSGNTALAVTINASNIATITIPTINWFGAETITFTATDPGLLSASDAATFTVNAVNDAPVVLDIPDQTVAEGTTFATVDLNTYVTDVDNLDTEMSWTYSGNTELTVSIDVANIATITIPSVDWNGAETITFTATDPGLLADSDPATFTVTAVNDAPVVSDIPDQTIDEGFTFATIDLNTYVTDLDNLDSEISWTFSGNTDLSVSIDVSNIATITMPDVNWNGAETITFTATDPGLLSANDAATFTVNPINDPPVVADIPGQTIDEGGTFTTIDLNNYVSDVDNLDSEISWTYSGNTALSVSISVGNIATIIIPDVNWNGSETITFTATDPGLLISNDAATFTVNAVNDVPVVADIPDQTVAEGSTFATVDLNGYVTDIDNLDSEISWTYTGNTELTVAVDASNIATITIPSIEWNGSETITFRATDPGLLFAEDAATFTVTFVNDPPVLAAIGAQNVTEGVNLNFGISATDLDGTFPTLSASPLPSGATLVDNGDGTATFDWTPLYTQAGSYNITFTADDGTVTDDEIVTITVNEAGNQVPIISPIGPKGVAEGVLLSFVVTATDPDGTIPSLSTSALPTGATFTPNGDGTGTFSWTPDFTQAGSYNITFAATDGSLIAFESVAITVNEAGSQAPVVSDIVDQTIDEGQSFATIDLNALVADPDNLDSELSWSYTGNTDLTVSIDASNIATITTPDADWFGAETITFTATDPGLLTGSDPATFTVNNVNDAPVVTDIPDQTVNEGGTFATVNLNNFVSDVDNLNSELSWTYSGNTELTVSIDLSNIATITIPNAEWSGSEVLTFTATDPGLLSGNDAATFTVNAVNDAPVLAAIGPQSTTENVLLTFGVSATDIDGTIPALSVTPLPTGASFVDNGDGTGTFSWTPDYTQARTYDLTFTADDGSLTDAEIVTITVIEAGNQPPVLAAIGPQATTEGLQLTFGVSASDLDGTFPSLTTSALPSGAVFTDNGDGTGSFDWTPNFNQAGIYNITFTASDGLITDDEVVQIVVNSAGNQLPVLAPIGPKAVIENALLAFSVSATDPDGTTPLLTASPLPTGASFVDNGDGTGSFNWTPTFTQSGSYNVTFSANDGSGPVSEIVTITVNDAGNQAPVLAAIGSQNVTENNLLSFAVSATDIDGTIPTLSTSALPTGASFVDNGNGTGQFSWTPDFTQEGSYDVTFTASDGSLIDEEIVTIIVNDAGNQAPLLAAIGAQATTENVLLTFNVSATDNDGTTPFLGTSALPTGASFVDNGDGTGSFSWTPGFTQAGSYDITFTASDGFLTDDEIVTITVNESGNQAPVLAAIGPKTSTENALVSFSVSASDPDGTTPALSTSALPTGASFVDNGDGTGQFDWTPDFTQSGVYNITFTASDGSLTDDEIVAITITESGNQAPVVSTIPDQTVDEGATFTTFDLDNYVTDPDNDITELSWSYSGNSELTVAIDVNNVVTVTIPSVDWNGAEVITFTAQDPGLATGSSSPTFTVNSINDVPVLAAIGAQAANEGAQLTFGVSATDADGTIPALSAAPLPTGATFVDNGDGTGTFDWTPGFTSAGSYDVTFTADDGTAQATELVTITVSETGDQPPVIAAIGDQIVAENTNLTFLVSATDPDGLIPSLTTSTLPTGATFADNGDGSGTFDWTPTFEQTGIYVVIFIANDGSLVDSQSVTITVTNTNLPPVLAAIGNKTVEETRYLVFSISATDPDGTTPMLSTTALPTGATFSDKGDGTGDFYWNPQLNQRGTYNVTFFATDSIDTVSEQITITVNPTNIPPVLTAIGPQVITEGQTLVVNISATDPDGGTPQIQASNLPDNSSITDNGDGTGQFTFTPSFIQSGLESVTIKAFDGIDVTKEVVLIQVYEAGDQPPFFDSIPAPVVIEGELLEGVITATDPDTLPVFFYLDSTYIPPTFDLVDNGDGSASYTFEPDYTMAGLYDATIIVSDGNFEDTIVVTLNVTDAGNQTPTMDPVADQTVKELNNLTFSVTGSDPDGDYPILTTSTLPGTATFNDNGAGLGFFNWTPDAFQAGDHLITFYAVDNADPLLIDSVQMTITVIDTNRVPGAYVPYTGSTINEGDTLVFLVYAQDPDETIPTIEAFLDGTDILAPNMEFVDSGNGVGSLTFMPSFSQGSTPTPTFYNIRFRVCDETDATLCSTTSPITVKVADRQLAPILSFESGTGPFTIDEGVNLGFNVVTVDIDGGTVVDFRAENLPANATFTGTINQKYFSFTPDFTQAGVYNVSFISVDNSNLADTVIVEITVLDAGNQAPEIISPIGDTTEVFINIGAELVIEAYDPDNQPLTITATPVVSNASFVDSGNGMAVYTYYPDSTNLGVIDKVTFIATDNMSIADTLVTNFTVSTFKRGDLDDDAVYTMNDIVVIVNYIFRDGAEPYPMEAGDIDHNGSINMADIGYLINYMYKSGPKPPQ